MAFKKKIVVAEVIHDGGDVEHVVCLGGEKEVCEGERCAEYVLIRTGKRMSENDPVKWNKKK